LEFVAREIYIALKINRNLDISKICKMAIGKLKSSHIEKCTIPPINIKDIYGLHAQELDKINSCRDLEKRGILIHGDSGVGKSALAFALINESGMDCIYVDAPRIRSKIVGESEKNIMAVFNQAKACRPCVILVDQVQ
jgi:DNA replication protein DnaC